MSGTPTKSYFLDINRYSSQSNTDTTTNIWDFKLNDTILAPSGSEISIHQAFINQKGITGQSIEFEEDISETLSYYLYITDDIHATPVAQAPYLLRQKEGGLQAPYRGINLLNNIAETGRAGANNLWGQNIQKGTSNMMTHEMFGGCGTPLILSTKPTLIETPFNRTAAVGNTNGAGKTAGVSHADLTAGSAIVALNTELPNIRVGASITGVGIAGGTTIISILPTFGGITMSQGAASDQTYTELTINGHSTNEITGIPIAVASTLTTSHRIVGSGIPLNTFVNNINVAAGIVGMRYDTDPITSSDSTASHYQGTFFFYKDPDFYVYPVPSEAFITIKKGVYGIEQLTAIINRQLNGSFKSKTEIPITNTTSNLSNGAGLTRNITPTDWYPSPDGIPLALVNPATQANPPDHTFIPAIDYAKVMPSLHNKLQVSKVNFTQRIDPTLSTAGYVGYLMTNQEGNYQWDVTTSAYIRISPDNDGVDNGDVEKFASDYFIGEKGLLIGAPEFNIDYDTNLSGFSMNNLHSSYRIASHDLLGNSNANGGKVGVGLKRVARILDWSTFLSRQSVWGDPETADTATQPDGSLTCDTTAGSNVITNLKKGGNQDITWASIGSVLTGEHFAADTHLIDMYDPTSTTIPTTADSSYYCAVLDKNINAGSGIRTNQQFQCAPSRESASVISSMNESFERPVSRIGGAIVYNFGRQTAIQYGTREAVVNNGVYNAHASFKDFFNNEAEAKAVCKQKSLWGKLGFSYDQLNSEDYMEDILQYAHPKNTYKLRGITSDTRLDLGAVPQISTQNNPSKSSLPYADGGAAVANPQNYNNWDVATCRTQRCRRRGTTATGDEIAGDNQGIYSGSRYEMSLMYNVVAPPSPLTAENLPTLSNFGYYLITSDLVPTYKDVVAKGDPIGLLGVVAKTNLSNQDFIPLAESDIVQVLNQDTIINNIRVKVLNPDLSNPQLAQNSSIILRLDVPIEQPVLNTESDAKTPRKKKRCPKTGEEVCKCPKGETCDKSKKENLHKKK